MPSLLCVSYRDQHLVVVMVMVVMVVLLARVPSCASQKGYPFSQGGSRLLSFVDEGVVHAATAHDMFYRVLACVGV